MGKETGVRSALLGLLLGLTLLSLCACSAAPNRDAVAYIPNGHTPYPNALRELLPAHEPKAVREGMLQCLQEGLAIEAFDVQAQPALEIGLAAYWYPQYVATVVIAVDRDRTDALIAGWGDLDDSGEEIGYPNHSFQIDICAQLCALAYGLEGEGWTTTAAVRLLESLHEAGRLRLGSAEAPLLVCFDYQAVQMIDEGRHLEIIVPAEGTFSYTKGLLNRTPLELADGTDEALIAAGLRLPDGRCDQSLYPQATAYASSRALDDADAFNRIMQNVSRTSRREIQHVRVYATADSREHQIAALVYIAVMLLWAASVVHRAMQTGVRRAALLTGLIMLGWVSVRLVKYQLDSSLALNRYLWYSFYLFQLTLPLVLLWLAWVIDRPEDEPRLPNWLRAGGLINGSLIVLVFSNDLHNLVFRLDLSNPLWSSEYSYGPGFIPVTLAAIVPLLATVVLMMRKSARTPSAKGRILPLLFFGLLIAYGLGYIARVPIAWQSDMTMMAGVFALLYFESAIRSGMIPVNTKYRQIFSHSPLHMQILDSTGSVALASAAANPLTEASLAHVLAASPQPLSLDEHTLLFGSAITGGFAAWEEDISGLNRLHEETAQSVQRLEAANALLREEAQIAQLLSEEAAKKQLTEQLEAEIAERIGLLSRMIAALPEAEPPETAPIALLLCSIKRRCNLFFREKEGEKLGMDELIAYLEELAELAEQAGLSIAVASKAEGELPVRQATLFYDFFYEVAAWAIANDCRYIIQHLSIEAGGIAMRLLPSKPLGGPVLNQSLREAIAAANGELSLKDLDDTVGIALFFPEGGGGHA